MDLVIGDQRCSDNLYFTSFSILRILISQMAIVDHNILVYIRISGYFQWLYTVDPRLSELHLSEPLSISKLIGFLVCIK